MSMRKTTLAPWQLLSSAFCSHGQKLPRQGGLPGVVQWVSRLSKLPQDNENSCEQSQASDHTQRMTPGSVSCPRAMSCPGIM